MWKSKTIDHIVDNTHSEVLKYSPDLFVKTLYPLPTEVSTTEGIHQSWKILIIKIQSKKAIWVNTKSEEAHQNITRFDKQVLERSYMYNLRGV